MTTEISEPDLTATLIDSFHLAFADLNPFSKWFSYGSNLNRARFAKKMEKIQIKGAPSKLTIINARVAALPGYRRKLGNESSRRCLAYTIEDWPSSHVMGIVHEVPIEELHFFLTMEGVCKDGKLRPDTGEEKRRYDILKKEVLCTGSRYEALTLIGRLESSIESKDKTDRSCKKRLDSYVRESRAGARRFKIDTQSFDLELEEIKRHFTQQ